MISPGVLIRGSDRGKGRGRKDAGVIWKSSEQESAVCMDPSEHGGRKRIAGWLDVELRQLGGGTSLRDGVPKRDEIQEGINYLIVI